MNAFVDAWPPTWRAIPLRTMFRRIKDVGHPDEAMLSVYRDHGVVKKGGRDDNFNKTAENRNIYQLVDNGWLIVNRMKAWQGSLGISPLRGIVSGHYICFQPEHNENPRFLNHLLRSSIYTNELRKLSRGVRPSQIEIDNDLLGSLPIHLPPREEQRAIADFLDGETARIDALIDKKRRLTTLLTGRFDAEIRHRLHTLTFPVLPLKRFWTVTDCKHRTPEYVESGYPVVSPGDATPGRLDLARCHRFVTEEDYRDLAAPPRRPERGSIIYSRNASIGIASYVDTEEPFCMGQDVCLITSTTQNQLFLTYVLNSTGVDQLEAEKIGSTFSRINVSQILDLRVPTPPVDVQRELAEEWDEKSSTIGAAANRLTQQITLLEEKRRALITAAVTGEFAVPGASAA